MKKVIVSLVLVFSLILSPISTVFQPTERVEASTTVIGTGVVNTKSGSLTVRQSNSTSAKKIGSLAKGTTVSVLAQKNGWYKIKYKNSTGWVSGSYIKYTPAANIDPTKDYIDYVNFNIDGVNKKMSSILRNGSTYINIRDLIPHLPTTYLYYANNIILLQVNKNGVKRNATIDLNQANRGNQYLAIEHGLKETTNMIPVNTGTNKNAKKPIIYNNRTYVNIDDINKIFSTKARWDGSTRTVYISYKGQSAKYVDPKTKKVFVYLNDSDARSYFTKATNENKRNSNFFSTINTVIDVAEATVMVVNGNPAYKLAAFTIGAGIGGLNIGIPTKRDIAAGIAIKLTSKDLKKLKEILGTPEYQGRGVYYEVDKKGKIVGTIKQQ